MLVVFDVRCADGGGGGRECVFDDVDRLCMIDSEPSIRC